MFPFDLSFETVLIAVIALILILYVIAVVKLKSPNENESKSSFKRYAENLEKPITTAETKKKAAEQPALPVETQKIPEEPTKIIQSKAHAETQEIEKAKKDKEAKKSFLLYGKKDFEGCPHKFGFLKDLSKNTPIPDECFGCAKVIECLTAVLSQ